MFLADRIVTHDFPALGLMFLYFRKSDDLWAEGALDPERVNDFFHNPGGTSNFDVFMAHRAVFVQDQPIFNAELAEQLVAIVTFFCISAHFYHRID